MDKISSILPGNNRVQNVDMDGSHPIRPGTTSFGRPEGSTSSEREKVRQKSNADRAMFSEQARQAAEAESGSSFGSSSGKGRDLKEEAAGRIADQVSRGFSDTVRRPTAESSKETSKETSFDEREEETPHAFLAKNQAGNQNAAESVRSIDKYA